MTALPNKASFTDGAVNNIGLRNALDGLRDYLNGLLDDTGATPAARTKLGLGSAALKAVGHGLW